jgi:hypothetical protein
MNRIILTLMLATSLTLHAQEEHNAAYQAEYIKMMAQQNGAKFMRVGVSLDGQSVRWAFDGGYYHGYPVVIDTVAYPSLVQYDAAAVAAYAEATAIYRATRSR